MFTRYADEEEIDRLNDFWMNTDISISSLCNSEEDPEEFEKETFRFIDMIRSYNDCPATAAETYNAAKKLATQKSEEVYKSTYRGDMTKEEMSALENAAFTIYCKTMTEDFFNVFIRYRWKQVKEYQTKTSVLCQGLYHDYLNALDVPAYVEYTPPFSA